MRTVDMLLLAGIGLVLVGLGILARMAAVDVAPVLIIAGTVMLAALMLQLHRRLRQAQRDQLLATANATAQVEALFSIFATVQPSAPLPPLGGWAATPDLLRLLLDILAKERPQAVLEASSGASTLILAYGLRKLGAGGRIYSLEHDAGHAARTREALAAAGLMEVATVIDAPLVEHQLDGATWLWYDLGGLPLTAAAGLLVVDGPPGTVQPLARYPALPLLQHRLTATATVVMDDARRPDERAIAMRWAAELEGWSVEFRNTEKGSAVLRRIATLG